MKMLYYMMNDVPLYSAFCLGATALAVGMYAVRWAALKVWSRVRKGRPYQESMWD